MIKILSVQNPNRVAKSSILRLYIALKENGKKVNFLCIGNDIFHRILDKNKTKKERFLWQSFCNFSYWYFPGLIPINKIDITLSRIWAKSYIKQLKLEPNENKVLIIAEAGPSSIIVRELLLKYKNLKVHYRINDQINSFRVPSAYVAESHERILGSLNSNITISAPAPMPNKKVLHIPPGVDFINRSLNLQKNILYWGVYPIAKHHLQSLLRYFHDYKVQYTGSIDHKVEGTEFLGFLSPSDLSNRISTVSLGVMIFPDDRFDWWLWSNKMLLMQSLNIPIIGMLKESGDNIFDIYPNMTSIFEEHGFVRHQEIECSKNKTFEFYDWNIFTKKIIGDHTV